MSIPKFRSLAAHEVVSLGFEGFYSFMTKQQPQFTLAQAKDKYDMYVDIYNIHKNI